MDCIIDINHNPATTPRMQAIADIAKARLSCTYLTISVTDNLCSAITIYGSFDKREAWKNGIFENSKNFKFMITSKNNKRYYEEGDHLTVELLICSRQIINRNFRKYTGTPEKVIAKIADWIDSNRG